MKRLVGVNGPDSLDGMQHKLLQLGNNHTRLASIDKQLRRIAFLLECISDVDIDMKGFENDSA